MHVGKCLYLFFILWIIVLLTQRCASVVPPTGGPKDTIPPSLVVSKPAIRQLNYKEPKIILTFNEWIRENNLKKELLIAPIPSVNYSTKTRKKTFILTFDSLLEANTTYTFNFRNGICDVTENNPTKDNYLIFSTGNYIDSFSIGGKVAELLTQKPVENAVVMLFDKNDSLLVEGGKPLYVTETDKDGNYQFENLRSGLYEIFALKEKDGNMRYSQREELIGFLPHSIPLGVEDEKPTILPLDNQLKTYLNLFSHLPDSSFEEKQKVRQQYDSVLYVQRQKIFNQRTPDFIGNLMNNILETSDDSVRLSLKQNLDSLLYENRKANASKQDSISDFSVKTTFPDFENASTIINFQLSSYDFRPLKRISARPNKQYFEVKFNKEEFLFDYQFLDSSLLFVTDTNLSLDKMIFCIKDKETLRFFKTYHAEIDSLPILLKSYDSIGSFLNDTVTLRFKKISKPEIQKWDIKIYPSGNEKFLEKDSIKMFITFSKPLLSYNADSAFLVVSRDTINDTIPLNLPSKFSKLQDTLYFGSILYQKNTSVLFKKGSFVSVEKDTSSFIVVSYKSKNPEEYASLAGEIICQYPSIILQVLSEKYEVEQEIKLVRQSKFRFEMLKPGTKWIRVLIDENSNGKWDQGSYRKRILPEKVYLYPQSIPLKANWDVLDTKIIVNNL
ncbi:MAG: Ig-like domain-containing protein [Cytophagales bacterium]|nr:Ig-like domain-containing protein [Cytophagales bacterium]MDW8384057.1 Ig-like domain-containing protein [Flammeovirgaceae bacterium]